MKKRLWPTAILASLFFLTYCSNYKQLTSETEALFRKKWTLAELQGQQVPESAKSSFEFTPGKISGSTGCNRLSAGFVAGRNQTIKFLPDSLSKTTCPDETAAALETRFMDALSKSTKWDMKGGELWLGDGESTLIKLRSFLDLQQLAPCKSQSNIKREATLPNDRRCLLVQFKGYSGIIKFQLPGV